MIKKATAMQCLYQMESYNDKIKFFNDFTILQYIFDIYFDSLIFVSAYDEEARVLAGA